MQVAPTMGAPKRERGAQNGPNRAKSVIGVSKTQPREAPNRPLLGVFLPWALRLFQCRSPPLWELQNARGVHVLSSNKGGRKEGREEGGGRKEEEEEVGKRPTTRGPTKGVVGITRL